MKAKIFELIATIWLERFTPGYSSSCGKAMKWRFSIFVHIGNARSASEDPIQVSRNLIRTKSFALSDESKAG
jgi:hypothetical protein